MTEAALCEIPVFKSSEGYRIFEESYNRLMDKWPTHYETIEIETEFGYCHVVASGPQAGKPILMFHGMTGNSAMWYPTVEALEDYRVYCIDTPGDFGKSKPIKAIRSPEDAVRWI